MKVTLDLPEANVSGHPGYEPDGSLSSGAPCVGCGEELYGLIVRLHPLGWLHAEAIEDNEGKTCQEKAVEKLLADPRAVWIGVARHVAKYPSKHGVATLRAVITELAKLADGEPAKAAASTAPLCDCGQPIPINQRKAYCSDRCRWADDDHGPNGDDQ